MDANQDDGSGVQEYRGWPGSDARKDFAWLCTGRKRRITH
jgi:hypothetical protein